MVVADTAEIVSAWLALIVEGEWSTTGSQVSATTEIITSIRYARLCIVHQLLIPHQKGSLLERELAIRDLLNLGTDNVVATAHLDDLCLKEGNVLR